MKKQLRYHYQRFIRPLVRKIYIRTATFEWRSVDPRRIKKQDIEQNFRKALKSPYLYLSLGLVVGLLFTVQFKNESKRPLRPTLFHDELVGVKEDLFATQKQLNEQIRTLQQEIGGKERVLAKNNSISQSTLNSLSQQEMLLGSSSVSGNGVVITLSDGPNQIKDQFSKSLTHAADLRDLVNILWFAGAEGISINGERIIYNTSIDCIVSTIMINTTNYVPPFTIKAIGSIQDIGGVVNNSRKLVDIKKRAAKRQIEFSVEQSASITIDAYSGIYTNL